MFNFTVQGLATDNWLAPCVARADDVAARHGCATWHFKIGVFRSISGEISISDPEKHRSKTIDRDRSIEILIEHKLIN